MPLSDFSENRLLNLVLKPAGADFSGVNPTVVMLALFTNASGLTADSLETNQGTGAVIPYEVTGGGYVRRQITFNAPSGGEATNSNTVDFGVASTDWGTVTHYALLNVGITDFPGTLFYGEFDIARPVFTGDRFIVYPGQLKVRFA